VKREAGAGRGTEGRRGGGEDRGDSRFRIAECGFARREGASLRFVSGQPVDPALDLLHHGRDADLSMNITRLGPQFADLVWVAAPLVDQPEVASVACYAFEASELFLPLQ
jgi:hypothetical protein